jgi:hypothetical protein
MDKRLFFHIGSPKAASTFLQLHVFPKSPRFFLGDNLKKAKKENNTILDEKIRISSKYK